MEKQSFSTLIIGQPSLDINTDHDGTTTREVGGAVLCSGYAAAALGHKIAVLPRMDPAKIDILSAFASAPGITVLPLAGNSCTSIENIYHTADKERRTCRAIGRIQPYRPEDIPDIDAKIYHLAGLMNGDFAPELIPFAAGKARCALDVQSLLRCVVGPGGEMEFRDWADKQTYLPLIHYLKTDAAEAEILTGLSDRREAARQLHAWGAQEIMITHNTEVLVYDGQIFYTQPLKPRNLSGRSGRGDTTFSAYINERLARSIPEALLTAAALVSLKMESPGPFMGSRADVEAYIKAFYTGSE